MAISFSMLGYQQLLTNLLAKKLTFVAFDEFVPAQRIAALRHDVDADLEAAVSMAELERDFGIQSTYFLMLRSPLYNLLNSEFASYARRLGNLGHWIGLHYDENYDAINGLRPQETVSSVFSQVSQAQELTGHEVRTVSFHQPSQKLLAALPDLGSLVSTYDFLHQPGYSYVADSNRSEQFQSFFSRLEEGVEPAASLQILIHPMWWFYADDTTEQVWNRVMESNFRIAQKHVLVTERAFGAERDIIVKRLST